MKNQINIVLYFLLALCTSCILKKSDKDYFGSVPNCKKNIKEITVRIDTILLDKIESSYVGKFHFFSDSIYFIDEKFCKVFVFNVKGKHSGSHLGQGGGPSEIKTSAITGFSQMKDGSFFIVGPSYDCYIYNKDWLLKKKFRIQRSSNLSKAQINNHPKPEMPEIYDIDYEKNMKIRELGNIIYVPIESLMNRFHPVMESYYKESRIFFQINKNSGEIIGIEGRRSPFYQRYNFIGQFSWFNFDITNEGNIYVCHEPDSLIYKYDSEMNNIQTFGIAGKQMNTNYIESKSFDQTGMNLYQERTDKGYYTDLEYIDETGLLFRSYQKGKESKVDGIQVYKNGILLTDIDVPKGTNIIGYQNPYYYSSGLIDEDNEKIIVLRFKLGSY